MQKFRFKKMLYSNYNPELSFFAKNGDEVMRSHYEGSVKYIMRSYYSPLLPVCSYSFFLFRAHHTYGRKMSTQLKKKVK